MSHTAYSNLINYQPFCQGMHGRKLTSLQLLSFQAKAQHSSAISLHNSLKKRLLTNDVVLPLGKPLQMPKRQFGRERQMLR